MGTPSQILLADDEETFLEATRDLLEEQGFVCHSARNAGELSESLTSMEIDLLITDLNMPGNRVLEMVEDIRRQAKVIPVIVVTGYPSVPSAVESVRLNVLEYIIKPVQFPVLLDAVKRGIKQNQVLLSIRKAKQEAEQRALHLTAVEQTLNVFQDASAVEEELHIDRNLQELQTHIEGMTKLVDAGGLSSHISTYDYYRLREGLYNAIHVLQQTKSAFRSKALADLRLKLQKLLQETASEPPKDSPSSDR